MTLTAVYLAAGVSSRFGGRIKALAKVGKNNESLMEISMKDARAAGFDRFVIIASDKTLEPLDEAFGVSFEGCPVEYCIQKTPSHRQKPFGTAHAVLAAKDFVKGPFIVLNGDDLYGKHALKTAADFLRNNSSGYCIPGYKMKNVLPDHGTVNRGIIHVAPDGSLGKIVETFNIAKTDVPSKFSGEELISMNLFGFQPAFLDFCESHVTLFIDAYGNDLKKECLLPDAVSVFLHQTGNKMKVLPVDDVWLGLTNPEDEAVVRDKLRRL